MGKRYNKNYEAVRNTKIFFDLEVAICRKLVDIIEKYVQEKYFFY